jgi:glycosyltransferase involved in cell wall biosynthesis
MQEIAARSDRLIVMSEHSSHLLQDVFRVPEEKIDLIPHGVPDLPFAEPDLYKDSFSAGKTVLLTFGLLSPNKGFENVIQALPRILSRHSNVIYIIAGATHPHVKRREGDRYPLQLQALAKKLGVEDNVVFHNRFVSPQEMAALVASADIYVTPYRHEAQAVSGTLAMPWALGRRSSRLRTGTPPNFWLMGAERWFPSRIQPRSQIRQSGCWTMMRPATRCAKVHTSMHATWSGTG